MKALTTILLLALTLTASAQIKISQLPTDPVLFGREMFVESDADFNFDTPHE